MKLELPAIDDDAGWRGLMLALTGVTVAIFLAQAFFRPLTLSYDAWAIQDDARQFLAWMPRLSDPAAMRGDLIADYWQSVSPPLYQLPFRMLAAVGILPSITARLLPAILLPLTALATWPVARRLTDSPAAAFVAAAAVMATVVHDDSIFTATPRAATVALVLLFVRGLIDERPVPILGGLLGLALIYPAPAATCLGMLALSRLKRGHRLGIDLSRRSVLLVGIAGLLIVPALLAFRGDVARWQPTLTLAEIHDAPSVDLATGRSTIRQKDGSIGWLCSPRMGFVPEIVSCRTRFLDPGGAVDLLLFLPMLVLAGRWLRTRQPDDPDRIHALAIAAALVCWSLAALAAFKLHLPSRYSQHVLAPLEALALGRLAGAWLLGPDRPFQRASVIMTALLVTASFATPIPKMRRPADREAMLRIAALPGGTRLAGLADDLNFVPALTGRAVLATTEHAIPYQLGYYRPFQARLADSVTAVRSPDSHRLALFLRKYRIDVLAVGADALVPGPLPRRYAQALPDLPESSGLPALVGAPVACRLHDGGRTILFSGACLSRWIAGRP